MCVSVFEKDDLTTEEEEQRGVAKRKMLGNIKFIGTVVVCDYVILHAINNMRLWLSEHFLCTAVVKCCVVIVLHICL